MANNDSYYHELLASPVIVNTRSTSYIGILQYDGNDVLKLRPSIVHEPRMIRSGNLDMKSLPFYRLESEKPTIINTLDVQTVQPTTRKHIEDLIKFSRRQNGKTNNNTK